MSKKEDRYGPKRESQIYVPQLIAIPKRLEVENRPELKEFPLNILFGQLKTEGNYPVIASALYEPELTSYQAKENGEILVYNNTISAIAIVTITRRKDGWTGTKSVNGEEAFVTMGSTWEAFFTHLTMMGLHRGEPYKLEPLAKYL